MVPSSVFFTATAPTEIYTFPYTTLFRSLDRRSPRARRGVSRRVDGEREVTRWLRGRRRTPAVHSGADWLGDIFAGSRSEEHTSELQSQSNLVCSLLLEKKKKKEYACTLH